MTQTKTHFGFKDVDASEKTSMVHDVFASVASNYDVMNDLMSGGLHRAWKHAMVQKAALRDGMNVLDLAGGTGDIAFRMKKKADLDLTICDINDAMLNEGRNRAFDHSISDINWVCGNAECLPLPDRQFDLCTMAFGIRNVTDIPKALKDIHRTLKPGGKFMCLEFSDVKNDMLKPIYDFYSFRCIPKIGKYVAKDEEAYQYLVESIRQFPTQDRFASMLEEAGFERVRYDNFSGGIVALHVGWRI